MSGASTVDRTRLLTPPDGGTVEYLSVGDGAPRTLFAHGLAGSIEDVRPLAGGVPGTRVFPHLAGHGRTTTRTGGPVDGYRELARELRAVLDHTGADQALGVSLGSAALLRLMAETPDRLARAVIHLPSVLDRARAPSAVRHHHDLAAGIAAHDTDRVARALLRTVPKGARDLPVAGQWAARRAAELVDGGADPAVWDGLAEAAPLRDRSALASVTCPVLVIAEHDDDVHPVSVAEEIAACLPAASLHVFDGDGALWGHHRELRTLISGFLKAR